jgi:CheY-like chemotaxis protein
MPVSQRPFLLLVEDSDDDAFFFRWTLRKCETPCDVVHVADGGSAIAYLEKCLTKQEGVRTPDLIFLDLKIPTFSGFEVLSWIREHAFTPALDVVVLSGSEHASDMERAAALGAVGYLVKPVDVEQLRARLQACQERPGGAVPTDSADGRSLLPSIASA